MLRTSSRGSCIPPSPTPAHPHFAALSLPAAFSRPHHACIQLGNCCFASMFPGYTVLKFEEVLEGAAGEVEARAAREWLDTGALIQPLPAGLVTTDETGYDTRVVDKDLQKRRRRLSSETIVATQPKQLKRTAATKGGRGWRQAQCHVTKAACAHCIGNQKWEGTCKATAAL